MQFSKWKIGAVALVCMLLPGSGEATAPVKLPT